MTSYFMTVIALGYNGGHEYSYHTAVAAFEHELPTDDEICKFCNEMTKRLKLKSCAPVMMQRLHDEDKKENS